MIMGQMSTALVIIGVGKQYSKQTLKSNDSIVTMIFLDPISLWNDRIRKQCI